MEFYLGILLGFIAMSFLVWALARPRKGDVPHCRRCGFSLAGLDEPGVCPECGGDLARSRAVAIGEKRRKHRPIALALGFVIVATAMILLDRASVTGYMPVSEYKPAWLLTGEAYLLGDRRASIATAEIVRRVQLGELSAEHGERLLSIALARHAQTWRSFPDSQWKVIVDAWAGRQLTTAQIRRVLDNIYEDGFVIGYGAEGPAYEPGQSRSIDIGVNFRAGQLVFTRMNSWPYQFVHMKSELHERPDLLQNARSLLRLNWVYLQRPLPVAGQPRIDSQDSVLLYVPCIDGVYTGTIEYRVEITDWLKLASDVKAKESGSLPEYAICEIPIKFEVVSTEKHRFPVLEVASLSGEESSYLEVISETRHGGDSRWPYVFDYYLELKQNAGVDWEEVALAGHIVFRQGDRVVRQRFAQPRGIIAKVDLYVSSYELQEFEPGEIRVTYEHNEALAAWRFRFDYYTFKQVLGGPIELGTITIPEPNEAE